MSATMEIFEAQIVLSGGFSPATFSPDWFRRFELLGDDDVATAAEEEDGEAGGVTLLVSPQLTKFATDWVIFQGLPKQLTFRTRGPVTPALRDLVVGTLTVLPESVVTAIGLNFTAHYRPSTVAEKHKFGNTLVPKELWRKLFPDRHVGLLDLQVVAEQPGLDEASAQEQRDLERFHVQPSVKIPHGLFVALNNHRVVVSSQKGSPGGEAAAELIRQQWDDHWSRAIKMFDDLMHDAIGGEHGDVGHSD